MHHMNRNNWWYSHNKTNHNRRHFKYLWLSETIQWHRYGSTFIQVMAWSLAAPSHSRNQCWLIIKGGLWHSPESDFTRSAHALYLRHTFGDYTVKINATSPKGQWVNETYWTPKLVRIPTFSSQVASQVVIMMPLMTTKLAPWQLPVYIEHARWLSIHALGGNQGI